MTHRTSLLLASLALVVGAIAFSACGGGGKSESKSDGGSGSPEAAAKTFILRTLGLFSGDTTPDQFLESFAPECREGVKASDLAGVVGLIRLFAPQLADADIEDIDLGKVTTEKVSDGVRVHAEDPNSARVKSKGKWVPIDEFFTNLGFDSDDSPADTTDDLVVVNRDGKWYIGDCSTLREFASPFGETTPTSGATPSRGSTPSTGATTSASPVVGGNRSSPTRLGQPATVDNDKWQVTVVRTNFDAWLAVKAANQFNDPPAANEKMVLVTVRVKNVSKSSDAENIDDFSFAMTGSRNQLYTPYSEKTSCGVIPNELDANLFAGGETEGNVCFKVPSDETGLLLVWDSNFGRNLTFFALQ